MWETFESASFLPGMDSVPPNFVIPLPSNEKIFLPVDPDAYVTRHREIMSQTAACGGAAIWGVARSEELEWMCAEFAGGPLLYMESDPAVFAQVVRSVRLDRLFAAKNARIAFITDCGQMMSETTLAFGDEERLVARIFVSVSPSLFSRLLVDSTPQGHFITFLLKNVFLNQNEEEKERGRALISNGAAQKDLFPPAFLYDSLLRFLRLLIVASPGIRTVYREMTQPDPRTVLPLSIVILAWNRWDLTERCLKSIYAHPLPDGTETIVVDNGSTDQTPLMLKLISEKLPQIRPVRLEKNNGPAAGRDAALRAARGKTLIFLDNDVAIQHKRWLDILLEPLLLHPRVAASGAFGVIHTHDESETWTQKILMPGLTVPVSWISSFCIAVRKQALIDCGGWRPDLYHLYGFEDVALGWALRQAKWVAAVPGQFVPVMHGMNHRDGHYDYDYDDSGKKNGAAFHRAWGPRHRILNLAKGNQTLTRISSPVTATRSPAAAR